MAQRSVLFLTHTLPWPLDAGAKVRAYYVLRHLSRRYRVTLASFVRETDSREAIEHVSEFCEAVHTVPIRRSAMRDLLAGLASLATRQPALIVRERSTPFRDLLLRLTSENAFDAIHVDQIKMAPQIEGMEGLPPRLIDKHNVYHDMIGNMARLTTSPLRKTMLAREACLMQDYEGDACSRFDEIVAVTDLDARRLSEMVGGRGSVTAIPICIDPRETPVIAPSNESCDVLCVGAMFYPPNVDGVLWFAREVFPRVLREAPEARLRIVGPRPDRALLRVARREAAIDVIGYVNDVSSHFAASALTIVPLRAGSGMRVKILDAMARGLPLVSTRLGAEGIEAADGENILLADTTDEFAGALVNLLRDRDTRRRLAGAARRLVEERYDWRQRYAEFDTVYERLLSGRGSQ